MLTERLKLLGVSVLEMRRFLTDMERELTAAKDDWPDHQVVKVGDWKDRDEIPPAGQIWASDGDAVWLISTGGEPIGKNATRVKFWTVALIPAPPNMQS